MSMLTTRADQHSVFSHEKEESTDTWCNVDEHQKLDSQKKKQTQKVVYIMIPFL